MTHEMNKPYYEQAWAAPHTLNPDKLAQSNKTATFETFTDKHVLTDGARRSRSTRSPATATTTPSPWCICPRRES